MLSLQQYIEMMGIKANRTRLRDQLRSCVKYPVISLHDITNVLNFSSLASSAIKVKPELLGHLDPPFIANVVDGKGINHFNLIKGITSEEVIQYIPDLGDVVESYTDFMNKWTGVVVVAGAGEKLAEQSDEDDPELLEMQKYKTESVKQIPDFFSEQECREIIDFSESRNDYHKSMILDKAGVVKVDDTRTSYSINLPPAELRLYDSLRDRTSDLLKVPKSHIEGLQCVRYAEGQQFHPHWDSNNLLNRTHTLLVYLNDDFTGGETYFPELMLKVTPERGKALHFLNEDADGNVIQYSLHAGLPVKRGIKYACNIWVKNRPLTKYSH
jgi:hypothetical protein